MYFKVIAFGWFVFRYVYFFPFMIFGVGGGG